MVPARTGSESNRRKAVINTNSGNWSLLVLGEFMCIGVVKKLITPMMELIPVKCSEKTDKTTFIPL